MEGMVETPLSKGNEKSYPTNQQDLMTTHKVHEK